MSLTERSYRLKCIALEAELERLQKKAKDEDALPIVLDVLDRYPGAKAELIKRLAEVGYVEPYHVEPPELSAIPSDVLEERCRAILDRRDRERAEGKL